MASIQQIIAEIQLAQDLPSNHITKAVQIIRDAEQRLKIKGVNTKPRKASGKNLVTLQEWETGRAKELHYTDLTKWIEKYQLSEFEVRLMIEEFRTEMYAKGKMYANFKAAFMTYLAKGYLSRTMESCVKKLSTHIDTRGVTL